jgi:PD-(D/E)XK endonuclease
MEKRSTSNKGNLSESKVITSYIEAGFAVSIPFGGGVPYDLIVDTRARLLRIQVKTGRLRKGCILSQRCALVDIAEEDAGTTRERLICLPFTALTINKFT